MSKTVKQIADELGVSKQAVHQKKESSFGTITSSWKKAFMKNF